LVDSRSQQGETMPTFHRSTTAVALAAALALVACGDGSSDRTPLPTTTFNSLQNDFDALFGTFAVDTPVTTTLQMPVRGEATYDGAALYSSVDTFTNDIIDSPTSASRVRLTADFSNADIDGSLYDFRAADSNITMSGDLAIANGEIVNNVFDGDVQGTLTVNGTPLSYSGGQVVGNFLGSQAEAVSGLILQGSSPTPYNGVFVAER
jgi:hypothetical protein